jgi:hypothetical protein
MRVARPERVSAREPAASKAQGATSSARAPRRAAARRTRGPAPGAARNVSPRAARAPAAERSSRDPGLARGASSHSCRGVFRLASAPSEWRCLNSSTCPCRAAASHLSSCGRRRRSCPRRRCSAGLRLAGTGRGARPSGSRASERATCCRCCSGCSTAGRPSPAGGTRFPDARRAWEGLPAPLGAGRPGSRSAGESSRPAGLRRDDFPSCSR